MKTIHSNKNVKNKCLTLIALSTLFSLSISENSLAFETKSIKPNPTAPPVANSVTIPKKSSTNHKPKVSKTINTPKNINIDTSGFFTAIHYRIGFNGSGHFKDFSEDAAGVKSATEITQSTKGDSGFDKYKISYINGTFEVGYQFNDSLRFGIEGVYSKLPPDYDSKETVSHFEIVRTAPFAKGEIAFIPQHSPAGGGASIPAHYEIYRNPVLVIDLESHHSDLESALAAGATPISVRCGSPSAGDCPDDKTKDIKYYNSAKLAFKLEDPELVSYGALASARYDMHIGEYFTIYAGMGAGWLRVKLLEANNDTIGYQGRAGIGFELMHGLKLEVGYYYLGAWNDEFKEIPTKHPISEVKPYAGSMSPATLETNKDEGLLASNEVIASTTAHGKLRYGVHGVEIGASMSFIS